MNDNQHNTTVSKGRDGWKAETRIPLERGNGYQLRISTWKGQRGVYTSAGTERLDGAFVTTRIFRDFRETVIQPEGRCTEKTVREQHARALQQLPQIIEREAAWEAEQVAKSEADKRAAA